METPIIPSMPIFKKKLKSTPPKNNKPTTDKTKIVPVPKSGCNIISPNIKSVSPKTGNIPFTIFTVALLLFDRYLETNIIIPNFANSLGWIPNEPIPNQLLLPFLTVPKPGIKTKTNKITQISKIVLDFLYKI